MEFLLFITMLGMNRKFYLLTYDDQVDKEERGGLQDSQCLEEGEKIYRYICRMQSKEPSFVSIN
jgi:hypothetical protein